MSNIQKTLDSLQPYVIGIRYLEGTPLVDAVFKEGWTVPEDPKVKKVKGNDEMNYFMLFSEIEGIGLDELLAYVKKIIDINVEREKKHDLLREKVNELKEVFKKNSLDKLKRLKFSFVEEDLVPKLDDFDIDDTYDESFEEEVVTETVESNLYPENVEEYATSDEKEFEEPIDPQQHTFLDENGNPIELSEEELEIIEEEERARKNMEYLKGKKQTDKIKNVSSKVELPPR
jgi:hypothetical protein